MTTNNLFALIYQGDDSGDVPAFPDAVSASVDVLKAFAVKQNNGEELKWVEEMTNRFVAYVLVGDDEFNEDGESECFYVIDQVDLI